MSEADLKAELEKLKAENEALKKKVPGKIGVSMKVSEKGGLSVYGLGRFPVTLYMEQWEKLLAMADDSSGLPMKRRSTKRSIEKPISAPKASVSGTTAHSGRPSLSRL